MRISDWSSDVCSSDLSPTSTISRRLTTNWDIARGTGLLSPLRNMWRLRSGMEMFWADRSEERRVGKECAVRVDLGGRRIIKKKKYLLTKSSPQNKDGVYG